MVDGVKIKVEGLAELDRKLRSLGPKIARSALRSSLNAAAQVIKKDAILRAPVLTGRLAKKAIYVTRSRSSATPTKEVYVVGVRQWKRGGKVKAYGPQDAFYWRFLEFGTKHIAARPFLVPAFETKKQEAFERFKQKLREKIAQLTSAR
jgi:HK97 gp10 family phage protein